MSVIRKSSNTFSALSGAAITQYDPVKLTTRGSLQELTVIKASASSDKPVGVAKYSTVGAGEEMTLFGPGDKCLMRAASGGVTAGAYLKLDSSDPLEVVGYTQGVTTAVFCIGRALQTGAENDYIEVELILANDSST